VKQSYTLNGILTLPVELEAWEGPGKILVVPRQRARASIDLFGVAVASGRERRARGTVSACLVVVPAATVCRARGCKQAARPILTKKPFRRDYSRAGV
jgi:hypothetical protein